MYKALCKKISVILFFLLLSGISLADSEAEYYVGVVDDINHAASAVVVGDLYMKFNLNVEVYDLTGKKSNRYALKIGQKVECQLIRGNPIRVARMWIKPDSYSRSSDLD